MIDRVVFPAVAAMLLAVPASAGAQAKPAAPASAPAVSAATDAARVAAARTLVQTLRTEQQMRAQQAAGGNESEVAFDRLIPAQVVMRAQLTDAAGYARARAEAVRLIAEDRQRTADETIPLMVEGEVRRYAGHYSVDELKAIDAFYRSPIGQRVIAEQPKIAVDNVQFQQNVLAPILAAHSAALGPKLAAVMGPVLRQAGATATPAPAPASPPGKKK